MILKGIGRWTTLVTVFGMVFGMGGVAAESAAMSVVISEFTAVNDSGLVDEDGDRTDWLELHNYGESAVNLSGAYLTDDPDDPERWRFPSLEISPKEYAVVFLSGKNRRISGGQLHASFSLNRKGQYLALIAADGTTVIHEYAPEYPKQKKDISFGISTAWDSSKAVKDFEESFGVPTPGRPNGDPVLGVCSDVKFSVDRGWKNRPFKLSLRTKTKNAQIRYTLDGSVPTVDSGQPYEMPILIASTTTIRASAFKNGYHPSTASTRTFLFVSDVLGQSPDGLPPQSFPYRWGRNKVDYGLDPKIVNDPRYSEEIVEGFYSLPSISIVTSMDNLFDDQTGIYANPRRDGREWERPCSVELIHPNQDKGFQIDSGLRIRGGFSRTEGNPKHSFRLFFRDRYGPSKLKYPLFGASGASEFDHIDLRTSQNFAWHNMFMEASYLDDQFSRDLQMAVGQPSARGDYVHLFINGHYWGVYNTCERIKASYGAAYFGGKKDDYDAIKKGSTELEEGAERLNFMANDGNLEAWGRLWKQCRKGLESNEAYFRLMGRNPDGSVNPEYECLLDVENLIDYMLVILYSGNYDGPVSAWVYNAWPNNWYGIRNRNTRDGFRFFVWDAEFTFLDPREDRTGPFPAGEEYSGANPQWIWQQCLANEEFRIRVGDRIQRHFYGGGALTPRAVRKGFLGRVNQIESAVICESARWGDARSVESGQDPRVSKERSRNRDDDWKPVIDHILNEFIPARTEIVLTQLFAQGLISDVPTPAYKSDGDNKEGWVLSSSKGEVYFTTDGSDPRKTGGGIAPTAIQFKGDAIVVRSGKMLNVRTRYNGEWSPLVTVAK